MNLGGVGIFLWLAVFNFGEDILATTKFERTYWAFNTVEECVEFGDNYIISPGHCPYSADVF